MHSFEAPSGRTYFHDGDMSLGSDVVLHPHVRGQQATIHVPVADVLALAAEYIRTQRISALERATDAEVLGLD